MKGELKMKLEIEITQKGKRFHDDRIIARICICNGNWKYWDDMMEYGTETSLTINTINNSSYLTLPVKDACGIHDFDLYKETGEIQINQAVIRTYDSLLEFLNCRINNIKEDVKDGSYYRYYHKKGGRTFNAVLFEQERYSSKDICEEITFAEESAIEVKIKVVD